MACVCVRARVCVQARACRGGGGESDKVHWQCRLFPRYMNINKSTRVNWQPRARRSVSLNVCRACVNIEDDSIEGKKRCSHPTMSDVHRR